MAKAKPKTFSSAIGLAAPKGKSVEEVAEAPSGFDRVIQQTEAKATNDKEPAKVQRSREGMKKMTIHMRDNARDELRKFAMMNLEGQEEFVLKAINERLERMGADFQIS